MSLARLTELMDNNSTIVSTIARTANTTAYEAGDVYGNATTSIITFANVCNSTGAHFYIVGARLKIPVNALPSGMSGWKLHLYNASPTNIADGSVFNLPSGDYAKYLGKIQFNQPEDLGDNLFTELNSINKKIKLADGSQSLYAFLETIGAWTPASGTILTLELETVGC